MTPLSLLAVVAVAACNGSIGGPGDSDPGNPTPGKADMRGILDPVGVGGSGALACTPGNAPATTRLVRLTHAQYDNSIRDLTGLTASAAAEFLVDQNQAGFDRGIDLQVGDALGKAYRDAAEQLAATIVKTPAAYQKVVGCDAATGDTCARTYIAEFGKKAFRRPLSDAEKTAYLALFNKGGTLVDTGDNFQKGVQTTLQAFLQAPSFLYRVELSTQQDAGLIVLNSYEIAARLSYSLLNTTPDPTLMMAADAGALTSPEAVAAQARRLMETPAARETVRDFHHQWLDLDIYPNKLAKDPALYPTFTPDLAPALTGEVEEFVRAVTFDMNKGLTSLLTAPFTFVNQATAPIYGLSGTFGTTLQRADLDSTRRAGLLTQVGFLAAHSFSNLSSPIHRGVFIQRRLLCTDIPDPPPNIPDLPPLDGSNIKTTRQQVDMHTAPTACAGCHHAVINPPGFGLENYDAIGQFRTTENGVAIDASGKLVGTEAMATFTNGVELARAIAAAPEARRCYATQWLRYTLGRSETAGDSCAIVALATNLADDGYSAKQLLADMTRTKAFMFRTPEVK
jgi:hypothetical protein